MKAHQLPLFDHCGVCFRLEAFDAPAHHACGVALDRWIRDDNLDFLLTELELQKGQAQ
ncbi:hypothetical protein DE4585_00344 [Mycobacteroides salmoniphilum]|uniref:Uncharacterized protein n=1 Tax=Mycobacteroides salmoniphilum TaxID=404941 RepID=A0A4R8S9W1_9MYCO|nr:hypothetical protein DE4585_00344 [Mycobacteroides salmoniphilum]